MLDFCIVYENFYSWLQEFLFRKLEWPKDYTEEKVIFILMFLLVHVILFTL